MNAIFNKIQVDDWIEIDFSHWGAKKEVENKFQVIKQGILKRNVLEFTYIGSNNEKTRRIVYPLKLFFKGQTWYLGAYCVTKEDVRTFKISRIRNLVIKNESFQREAIVQREYKHRATENQMKNVNLKLKFSEHVLYQLYDFYDESEIKNNEDGTYTVDVTFPENEWVFSYILSFGYHVEVIEPLYIRQEIIRRLQKNLQIYK